MRSWTNLRSLERCSISAASACASSRVFASNRRTAISAEPKRPGAFKRGAMRNATSSAVIRALPRRAWRARAARECRGLRASAIALSPARTKARLSPSSGATSAIVPMATKSSQRRRFELAAERGAQRSSDGQRQAAGGQPLVREAALRPVRIQERHRRQRLLGHQVVVDHHAIDARCAQPFERDVVGRAAVAGHEQGCAAGQHFVDSGRRETPYPAFETAGDERHHATAQGLDDLGHDRGRSHAVAVVIAEDGDQLAGPDGARHAFGSQGSVDHGVRRGELGEPRIEEAPRGLHVGVATAVEQFTQGQRDAQAERELARTRARVRATLRWLGRGQQLSAAKRARSRHRLPTWRTGTVNPSGTLPVRVRELVRPPSTKVERPRSTGRALTAGA